MNLSTRQALQRRSVRQTPLKRFLNTHRISVSALADYLGLSRTYLSAIVNGWTKESTLRAWGPKIASVLEVEVDVILPKRPRKKGLR